MELVYSEDCPFCRRIASAINAVDVGDQVALTPIESERGRRLVRDHHGTVVHAPHLFTDDTVYYGIQPVARKLATAMPVVGAQWLGRRIHRTLNRERRNGGMASERDDTDCDDPEKSFLEALKDCIGGDESGVDRRSE